MSRKTEIKFDAPYQSNSCGPFVILREVELNSNGERMVEIIFAETGTRAIVRLFQALRGYAVDKYAPRICGVACIGNGGCYHPLYNLWHGMIARCYDPNNKNYQYYGAKGVTVCWKWRCFEWFLMDAPKIPGYEDWVKNPSAYDLDKDGKQLDKPYSERVYSLETCQFIPKGDNLKLVYEFGNQRRTSSYIGVRKTPSGSFAAQVTANKKQLHLGTFDDELAAACARYWYTQDNNLLTALNSTLPRIMSKEEIEQHRLTK